METPQLTEEQRAQILQEIEKREILEKAAVEQEKAAKRQQAELDHRQSLAEVARQLEEERKRRVLDSLSTALKLTQEALEVFQERGDERRCYVLLVKADSFFIGAKHQLNQAPERPSGGSLPTVRVRADNALGFAIINSEDLTPSHQVVEDAE